MNTEHHDTITTDDLEPSRHDTAEHLNSEEDVVLYLEAVLEENDPTLLAVALGNVARARNMSQLARDTGMSRQGLYKALSGEGDPSYTTLSKIAQGLGLRFTLIPLANQAENHA